MKPVITPPPLQPNALAEARLEGGGPLGEGREEAGAAAPTAVGRRPVGEGHEGGESSSNSSGGGVMPANGAVNHNGTTAAAAGAGNLDARGVVIGGIDCGDLCSEGTSDGDASSAVLHAAAPSLVVKFAGDIFPDDDHTVGFRGLG